MDEQDDKRLQLSALCALDQERAKTNDLSFAFLVQFRRAELAERMLTNTQAADCLLIRELREQLATSEQMRAELSRELQLIREQLMLCRELATDAVAEELSALEELEKLHYLSEMGRARMDTLRSWLLIYGVAR